MAEKDLNDPDKDYGLPEVEIKSLSQSSGPAPLLTKLQESKSSEVAPGEPELKEEKPIVEVPQEQEHEIEVPEEPTPQGVASLETTRKEGASQESLPKAKDEPTNIPAGGRNSAVGKEEAKTQSLAWIWIVVLLGIGVGAWALYTLYLDQPEVEQEPVTETIEEAPPVTPPPPLVEEIEEPVQKIGLTEIRTREENPRFFVVVGSFKTEAMAKDFSENLNQKEINTYLVYPYGEITNYRLAIAHFPSFDQALNELNGVKGDFKEDLWVLKY